MKTQRLTFLEALNFLMNGHEIYCYENGVIMFDKRGKIRVEIPSGIFDHQRNTSRWLDAGDFEWAKELTWYAGDDRSIQPFFKLSK